MFKLIQRLCMIMFSMLSFTAYAQNGEIRGTISGPEGSALSGITVSLEGTSRATQTDDQGSFLFRSIPEGNYVLVASSLGYRAKSSQVTVKGGQTISLRLELDAASETLKEVEVTAERDLGNSAVLTRTNTPLKDIPQQIQSVGHTLIVLPSLANTLVQRARPLPMRDEIASYRRQQSEEIWNSPPRELADSFNRYNPQYASSIDPAKDTLQLSARYVAGYYDLLARRMNRVLIPYQGQNGAGKTTTLNLFLGFIEATSGKAGGQATRQLIDYVPEVVQLYSHLTGRENLKFFSRLAGFGYTHDSLTDFLLQAGLQPEAIDRRLRGYSKGMRQKVGIAIALAKNAEVIFMDEPTSGLDPKATEEFTAIVRRLGREGKTVLMATHDIFNAVNLATEIGIMKGGQLIHTVRAADITALQLQQLYLETI